MDCKKILAEVINEHMRPIRERRALYASDMAQVMQILKTGGEKARAECQDTLRQVKDLMKLF
jgi:tryptophanyl-tRNA synthetase